VPRPAASPFAVDLLRASLGPALAAPYAHALGPVPWLTAGTLAWPVAQADEVLEAWLAWKAGQPASVLSAIRLGACDVAIDVAVLGDPWGVAGRLAALRGRGPALDTVATVGPALLRAEACVDAAALALPAVPPASALLGAPDGVCFGLRHVAGAGLELIGVGAATELPRVRAAVDQVVRALEEHVPAA